MNAIVDVYLDNNLGDDIMGETLINYLQGRGVKCYLLANDEFTYSRFIKNFSGVNIIKDISPNIIKENKIDCYIRIGGSIFPHNSAKEGILRYLTLYQYKMMKRNGVKIYILGCNVGPFKSSVGVRATKGIIKLSDAITCRDKETFEFISKVKKKNFYIFPDIVFSRNDFKNKGNKEKDVLGISIYTGYTSRLKSYNNSYCNLMSKLVNRYLEINKDGKVKLFIFDSGYNSDYPVAHKIYNNVPNKNKVEIIDFSGDIYSFMNEFNKCSVMVGTRFHSIVLAILCEIPVLPVIYSNKTRNLLLDIDYNNEKIDITDCEDINIDDLVQSICKGDGLLENIDNKILKDSESHLSILSKYLSQNNN